MPRPTSKRTPSPPKLYFDRKTQRYHDTARKYFLGRQEVKERFDRALIDAGADIFSVGDRLVNGSITVAEWEAETRDLLKQIRVWGYTIGAGGQRNLTKADYARMGREGVRQNKYLRRFAEELKAGKLSEAQFRYRLGLYINDADTIREVGRNQAHIKAGFDEERRIRTKDDSCQQCIGFAKLGWQSIGSMPDPGRDCDCRANCGCYKAFRRAASEFAKIRRDGWLRGGKT
jgi:hypothetical protein